MTETTIGPSVEIGPAGALEEVAIEVAGHAAELVRGALGRAEIVGTKSTPTDVVTGTDMAAEDLIRRELERRSPGCSILGEEQGLSSGAGDVVWIVDPIDGTVNFAYDLPVVGISLAATIAGRVVAGAVADVLRGEIYSAAVGQGARCDGGTISVGAVGQPAEALVFTGFSYDAARRAAEAETLTRVLPAVRDIRCMGSAALNLCWVASGRGDAFFERDLKVYDWAAAALVAAEAGAVLYLPPTGKATVDGCRHSDDDLVLAAGPGLADILLPLVS